MLSGGMGCQTRRSSSRLRIFAPERFAAAHERDSGFLSALLRFVHFSLLVSWLALTLGVWWAATNSFDTFNVEKNPSASRLFEPASAMKMKGRLAAREVNSRIFRAWNLLQLVFGVLALFLIWRTGRMDGLPLVMAGCLLLIVCAHVFWFFPKIETLGKILYNAEASGAAGKSAFGRYHGAYLGTDALKACLLFAAIWLSPWRKTPGAEAPIR